MVKTTVIRLSLSVLSLSPALHLVLVYDVLLYVCECMCMLCVIIDSVYENQATSEAQVNNILPAYTPISVKRLA